MNTILIGNDTTLSAPCCGAAQGKHKAGHCGLPPRHEAPPAEIPAMGKPSKTRECPMEIHRIHPQNWWFWPRYKKMAPWYIVWAVWDQKSVFLYSGPSVELNRVASLTNYWRVWGKFHASSGELNMMLLIRWEDIAAWDQVRWKTLAVQSHSYFFIQENTARNREVRIMIIWENRVWSSCSMFPLKMTIWGVYVPRPHFQTPFQKKDNFQRFHVLGVRVHQRCLLSLTWTRAAKPSDWWSFIIKNVVDPTINHP